MKAFFDASVLVPEAFIHFDKQTRCCGAHSLAEAYSTQTRMPGKHSISGEQSMLFVGSVRDRLSIVALNGDDYADTLQASAASGIVGGAVYDALLAHCAIKAKAQAVYTWNVRHYALCGPEITKRLRTP